jgi:autotransporter-associated beta strand protein
MRYRLKPKFLRLPIARHSQFFISLVPPYIMKSHFIRVPHYSLGPMVLFGWLSLQAPSLANRFWDGAGGSTGGVGTAGGGSGIWNTTNLNWDSLATGGTDITWNGPDNLQNAIFGGLGGTVTLGSSFNGAAGAADQRPVNLQMLSSGYTFDLNGFLPLTTTGIYTSLASGEVFRVIDSVNDNTTDILTLPAGSNPFINSNNGFFAQGTATGTLNGASALTSANSIVVEGAAVRALYDSSGAPFGNAEIILRGGTGLDPSMWFTQANLTGSNGTINLPAQTITVEANAVALLHVAPSGATGSSHTFSRSSPFQVRDGAQVVFTNTASHRLRFTGTSTVGAGSVLHFQHNNTTGLDNLVLAGSATVRVNNVGGAVARAGTVNLAAHQLTVGGASTGGFQIGSPTTGPAAGDTVNRITGTGTILKTDESFLNLAGQSTFSGGIIHQNGDILFNNSSLGAPGAPTSGPLGVGPLTLGGAGEPRLAATVSGAQTLHNSLNLAGNFRFGPVNGAFTHPVILAGPGTLQTNIQIATDLAGTLSGNITDAGQGYSLTKAGLASLTLHGTNSYSGTTSVTAGTLQVGQAGAGTTGTGPVVVKGTSTLLGTGTILGSSFTAESGSTVRAGDSAAGGVVGTLSFTPDGNGGSLDFQSGSQTFLDLSLSGPSDLLSLSGSGTQSLFFNGSLTIGPATLTPTTPGVYNLLDWSGMATVTFAPHFSAGSYSGLLLGNGDDNLGFDLPDVGGSGYAWDINDFTSDGTIALVLVPEPGPGLLLLLSLTIMRRRRRN